jgi:hypothetical protein
MATQRKISRYRLTGNRVLNVGGGLLGIIAGLAMFVTAWAYCTMHYGFLFGFGLGWLPAGMLASIVGAVWWFVSPLVVGLLLGSLLLIALWQAPGLLVWFALALLAVVIWRRRRFGEDVDWLGKHPGGRRRLKSRGKAENANGRILAALNALLANADRYENQANQNDHQKNCSVNKNRFTNRAEGAWSRNISPS